MLHESSPSRQERDLQLYLSQLESLYQQLMQQRQQQQQAALAQALAQAQAQAPAAAPQPGLPAAGSWNAADVALLLNFL